MIRGLLTFTTLVLAGSMLLAQTAIGPFWIFAPDTPMGSNAPAFVYWTTIDATNQAIGYVFRAPKTGTLDKVEFVIGTVNNTPDNGLRVSFQNISGDLPDNTQDQYRDITSGIASGAWIVPGLMTNDGTDGGAKRSVTVGDYLSVVVEFISFVSPDSVNFNWFYRDNNLFSAPAEGQSYSVLRNNSSVWAVQGFGAGYAVMALKYDDGSYAYLAPGVYPFTAFNTTTFNSGSTPDERGLRFKVPVSLRARAVWFRGDNTAAMDIVLYDSGSSVVSGFPVAVDSTVDSVAGGLNFLVPVPPSTLTANSTYRLVMKPTSGSDVTLYDFDVPGNAYFSTVEGGTEWYYTTRADAGSWTDTTTKRPWMGVLFDQVSTTSGEHSYPIAGLLRPGDRR